MSPALRTHRKQEGRVRTVGTVKLNDADLRTGEGHVRAETSSLQPLARV